MKFKKSDRGVAGLTILLSVVTMLFVIGLLIMIFALMSGELRDASYDSTSVTVTNENNNYFLNGTTYPIVTSSSGALHFKSFTITNVTNSTSNDVVAAGNYTAITGGSILNSTTSTWETSYEVNISYTYVYDKDNVATNVIGNTSSAIATTTDWFDIFIVITAMVVLILLTVIIITAIRGSGLMEGSA